MPKKIPEDCFVCLGYIGDISANTYMLASQNGKRKSYIRMCMKCWKELEAMDLGNL